MMMKIWIKTVMIWIFDTEQCSVDVPWAKWLSGAVFEPLRNYGTYGTQNIHI